MTYNVSSGTLSLYTTTTPGKSWNLPAVQLNQQAFLYIEHHV